jgi:hypothetical protein
MRRFGYALVRILLELLVTRILLELLVSAAAAHRREARLQD